MKEVIINGIKFHYKPLVKFLDHICQVKASGDDKTVYFYFIDTTEQKRVDVARFDFVKNELKTIISDIVELA